MTQVGTLSVSDDNFVTLSGYKFDEPLTWPNDPCRSKAIRALDIEIERLEKARNQLFSEVGTAKEVTAKEVA